MKWIYSTEMRKVYVCVCAREGKREESCELRAKLLHSDKECNYGIKNRHMALLQMCLHSALSWGWLITRDRGEREEQGQSLPSLPLACEQVCFGKSDKLLLHLSRRVYLNMCVCVCVGDTAQLFFTSSPRHLCYPR